MTKMPVFSKDNAMVIWNILKKYKLDIALVQYALRKQTAKCESNKVRRLIILCSVF